LLHTAELLLGMLSGTQTMHQMHFSQVSAQNPNGGPHNALPDPIVG